MNLLGITKDNYKKNNIAWNILWGILTILCTFCLVQNIKLYIVEEGFLTLAYYINEYDYDWDFERYVFSALDNWDDKNLSFGVWSMMKPFGYCIPLSFTYLILGISCSLSRRNTPSLTALEQIVYTSIVILFHSIILIGLAYWFSKIYLIIAGGDNLFLNIAEHIRCGNGILWIVESVFCMTFIMLYASWSSIRYTMSKISISWIKWSVFILGSGIFCIIGIVVLWMLLIVMSA